MLEFSACFALVGLTIAGAGATIFALLARHGMIRNAEEETRRLTAQLDRERAAGAKEKELTMRVEDLEGANLALRGMIEKLGMRIDEPKTPAGMDPEIMGEMPAGFRG